MNLTAERSLEIITEQIERSRRAVSKDTGQSLFVSGLCTMGMAVIVTFVNIIAGNNGFMAIGHLLWIILPLIIWLIMRHLNKNHTQPPVDLVGSLMGKTWWTFAVFSPLSITFPNKSFCLSKLFCTFAAKNIVARLET